MILFDNFFFSVVFLQFNVKMERVHLASSIESCRL